jgi:hypothetical protein
MKWMSGSPKRQCDQTLGPRGWADKRAFARAYGGIKVPVRWPAGTRQWGLIERVSTLADYMQAMVRVPLPLPSPPRRGHPVRVRSHCRFRIEAANMLADMVLIG